MQYPHTTDPAYPPSPTWNFQVDSVLPIGVAFSRVWLGADVCSMTTLPLALSSFVGLREINLWRFCRSNIRVQTVVVITASAPRARASRQRTGRTGSHWLVRIPSMCGAWRLRGRVSAVWSGHGDIGAGDLREIPRPLARSPSNIRLFLLPFRPDVAYRSARIRSCRQPPHVHSHPTYNDSHAPILESAEVEARDIGNGCVDAL